MALPLLLHPLVLGHLLPRGLAEHLHQGAAAPAGPPLPTIHLCLAPAAPLQPRPLPRHLQLGPAPLLRLLLQRPLPAEAGQLVAGGPPTLNTERNIFKENKKQKKIYKIFNII